MSDINDCIPDAPDIGAIIDKAKATLYGKKPNIDFTPIDFNIDISKYFDFNMIGKLLGEGGLGLDVCGHTIDGIGFDEMAEGTWLPAQDTIDGLNESIEDNAQGIADNSQGIANNAQGIADNAQGIADNAANQGGGTP
jgi:hypothetical protein